MEKAALRPLLGYLNLSSGAADPQFERGINEAYAAIDHNAVEQPAWRALDHLLRDELAALSGRAPGFESTEQAAAALHLIFDCLLPAYRAFHRDQLAHYSEESLFGPFSIAKAAQAVLAEGGPWSDEKRIVAGALVRLNNFIGYRPVAVLRTVQKIEPYAHEWVCPIPLYLAGAGVAAGPYHELVSSALDVLRSTPSQILDEASFDPELLTELSLDPRAYDFDHPANKRPNYHFGQWDPHTIDNAGRYRRFVLQAVTLDALSERVERAPGDKGELLKEAAVVLAGTMLMAAGVSGRGPETHDSSTTLSTLLPRIVAYRDAFYRGMLAAVPGPHGERLRAEARTLRQPFGGARHDLNQRLARLRAEQLQHVHLAQLFAAMGNLEASLRQANIVPVASARMLCEINGRTTIGRQALERGNVNAAAAYLAEIDDLLKRGIDCGAIVDPWNILGFGGQFPLFAALENSVRDHRVDVLVHLIAKTFGLAVQTAAEAAAAGATQTLETALARTKALAAWWDRFATLDVSGVESVSGRESVDAAEAVADALAAWRQAGATGGNIAFWRRHVGGFTSPRAFAVVIETLLDKHDFVAAMGLLVAWLSESERIALVDQEYSFHDLALRWLTELFSTAGETTSPAADSTGGAAAQSSAAPTALAAKFFDYLEANAGELWIVPRLSWQSDSPDRPASLRARHADEEDDEEDHGDDEEDANPYDAAYEGVTYLDTTDDGVEGETLSGEPASDYELEAESARLRSRVAFLRMLARLRASAIMQAATRRASNPPADALLNPPPSQGGARGGSKRSAPNTADPTIESNAPSPPDRQSATAALAAAQLAHATACERGLTNLLHALDRDAIPKPSGAHTALVEYDRRRRLKEALTADVVAAAVESRASVRWLRAAAQADDEPTASLKKSPADGDPPRWEQIAAPVVRGLLSADAEAVRLAFPALRGELDTRPILYVPLARGGDPELLVEAQAIKQFIVELLSALPRLGLVAEACQTIALAMAMERHRPKGEKAVTEFDRLFEIGYRSLVEALIDAADAWLPPAATPDEDAANDSELVESLQALTEPLLRRWLEHSQSVRLSALEKLAEPERWQATVAFIERYGHDLFTQRFLNQGSLRAILDQGTGEYLRLLEEDPAAAENIRLVKDLDGAIPRGTAVEQLHTIIEAIVENYTEYKDYNSTTTQSDHGEMLHLLLDFLRLKASYDRVCWNIRPLAEAHEILMRRGRLSAAELWRRALAEQTRETADAHIAGAAALSERSGMRLASINARLAERFVRPLEADALRALVAPAMAEVRSGTPGEAFARLEQEIDDFAEQAIGSGVDVPPWLSSLAEETARAGARQPHVDLSEELARRLPPVALTPSEIAAQLRAWEGEQ